MKPRFLNRIILLFFLFAALLLLGCDKEESNQLPKITTIGVTEITSVSANSGGNIYSNGGDEVVSRGLVWSTIENPSLEQHVGIHSAGSGIGLYTVTITELTPSTAYYIRAFASNGLGTAYGNQVSFTTEEIPIFKPTVATLAPTSVTQNSIAIGGTVSDDGGAEVTSRGVVWNTSPTPLLSNNFVESGSGLGNFNCTITNLELETTYYVRAYATNNAGTNYGNEVVVTTPGESVGIMGKWFSSGDNLAPFILAGVSFGMPNVDSVYMEMNADFTYRMEMFFENESVSVEEGIFSQEESGYGNIWNISLQPQSKGYAWEGIFEIFTTTIPHVCKVEMVPTGEDMPIELTPPSAEIGFGSSHNGNFDDIFVQTYLRISDKK
jgi:hypothetical protein